MSANSIDPVSPNSTAILPVVRAVLTNAVLQYEHLPEDARKKAYGQSAPINPWVDTDDFIISVLEQPSKKESEAKTKVYKVFISEDCEAAEAVAAGAYLVGYRESENKMWYAEIDGNPETDELNVLYKEERDVFDTFYFENKYVTDVERQVGFNAVEEYEIKIGNEELSPDDRRYLVVHDETGLAVLVEDHTKAADFARGNRRYRVTLNPWRESSPRRVKKTFYVDYRVNGDHWGAPLKGE